MVHGPVYPFILLVTEIIIYSIVIIITTTTTVTTTMENCKILWLNVGTLCETFYDYSWPHYPGSLLSKCSPLL